MKPHLLILADLAGTKAYRVDRPKGHPAFPHLLEAIEFEKAREHLRNLVSDGTGRFHSHSSQGDVSETGERSHLKLEIRQRILRTAIEAISTILPRHDPISWKFAAAPDLNGTILQALTSASRQKLAGNVRRNLFHEPVEKLLEHFQDDTG